MTSELAFAITITVIELGGQSSQGGYYLRAATILLKTWFVEVTI